MTTPTYTYSGDPSNSPLDAVRFWIQDIGPDQWLVADQMINYVLQSYPNPLLAAANMCRSIAARFAQRVTKRVGDLSINFSDKSKQYLALATELEEQGVLSGLMPYAGGTSLADKAAVASNTDRPRPPFYTDQFDNPSGLNNTSEYGWGGAWGPLP